MSKLICPFCGEKIKHIEDGWCNCKNRCTGSGSIELWLQFLRTRKALDVALCSLQDIAESNGDFITGASTPLDEHEYAEMMLNKIKTIVKGSNNE